MTASPSPITSHPGCSYRALSLKEMGALPGGAFSTFWDPEYRTSISAQEGRQLLRNQRLPARKC